MNKFEEIKAQKDGIDVLPDIERYARDGWEAITDDDKVRMKWYGVFFRKHTPGFFMMRIRVPAGIATTDQVRAIAGIAGDFGRGELDVTTRQQVQVRWFRIEDVPEIFARLRAVGLNSQQTGMDNIRNVMTCPLAGLTPHELFNAAPVAQAFTDLFVGNREFTNLPRKFNVAISACTDHCLQLETQDIALSPAIRHLDGDPIVGFNVWVGGKQGSGGFVPARALDVFVRPQDAAALCGDITLLYRDHGPRASRSRARLAFLLDDWGVERFRTALGERLGRSLEHAGQAAESGHRTDHLGLTGQAQVGLYSVGLSVPVGRASAEHTRALADLADRYGSGEVRFTPGQNVVIPNVPDRELRALLDEPLLRELRPDPAPSVRGTVACTGMGLCDLALTDTKGHALGVARQLESLPMLRRPIAINWSGCPASCGNHHLADIGLQGGKTRVDGEATEVYQVFAGGRGGPAARPAVSVMNNVSADEVGAVISRLAMAHATGQDLVAVGQQLAAERDGATSPPGREHVA